MKIISFLLVAGLVFLFHPASFSQIENVKVETYYISDANDATDVDGGHLDEGSTTYRIFIDLAPGSKILAIYGDEHHPLVFTSTASLFNHLGDGITFGKDLNKNRYQNGTVPLDSYITLGQCSRSNAQGAYFGIPKDEDFGGSVVGGINNDGGSEGISGGLLTNQVEQMGLPLTMSDGLTVVKELPGSWIDIGFIDVGTSMDTSIFASNHTLNIFSSTNALLRNSGVSGVDPAKNEVFIAQLTTKGEITFEINLEAEIFVNGSYQTVKYVARNESLDGNEIFEPLLKYPYTCGCKDPDYLEASTTYACSDSTQCHTPIVYGCTDSLACNYDPSANFNIPEICCYVGYCHDQDISVVCPDLVIRDDQEQVEGRLYPNPAVDELKIEFNRPLHHPMNYWIVDVCGRLSGMGKLIGQINSVPIEELTNGYYLLRIEAWDEWIILPFIKI